MQRRSDADAYWRLCAFGGILFASLAAISSANADPKWSSNVSGIQEMHLSSTHWIENIAEPDSILSDEEAIRQFNTNAYREDENLVDLQDYPDSVPAPEVAKTVRSISKRYSTELHYRKGGTVTSADYQEYEAALNLDALSDKVDVKFGLVVRRANMRTWPTGDVVFKSVETYDLDRFQENGLFPADAVAVLHESADGEWLFVQSYNYAAWVRRNAIAIGDREEIFSYKRRSNFIVVTGAKVSTNFNPHQPAVSELQLDMGVRLPLLDPDDVDHNVDGQNPFASYIVELPVRQDDGTLRLQAALIARSQDISRGYLPYTRRNILLQVFKFLGERYGWGHSYNARDCTGLVLEVYRTFGFILPRNSGQQGHSPIGKNIQFSKTHSESDKLEAVLQADIGDLLYSPGHVMMYLGVSAGQPYVIHDLSGAGWRDANNNATEGVLNGVSVTPLRTVLQSPESTYFESLYGLKQIR